MAGVVEVPRPGETFTAVAGHGAWLHRGEAGRRAALHLGRAARPGAGRVPGSATIRRRRRVQGEVIAALLPYVRDIRRGGSAAVDLCSVAAGRLDAYYERGLNYWDFAAGGLIAREAGRGGRRTVRPAGEHLHGGGRRPRPVPAAKWVPDQAETGTGRAT